MTPPYDDEAKEEDFNSMEPQARKDLEKEGCPPCYPPDLEYPLRDVPEKHRGIISYWRSISFGDEVLCRQSSDWKEFRKFQGKNRR